MTVKVKTSVKALADAAMAEIETVSVEEAMRVHGEDKRFVFHCNKGWRSGRWRGSKDGSGESRFSVEIP